MKKVIGKTSKAVYSSNNIIMMHIHWRQTELNSMGASKYKYIFGVGQKKRYTSQFVSQPLLIGGKVIDMVVLIPTLHAPLHKSK